MRRAVGPAPHLGRRDAALLVGAAFVAAAGPVAGKAGLLVTGQSNAGFFLDDGGIRTLNEGLAALLGLERARFDPRLDGIKDLDGYALWDGFHRSPAMATARGGTPLWAPGDRGAFLLHEPGVHPSRWRRGAAGEALDRFVRDLMTERDRADCLGVLWLHTEDDSRRMRMRDAAAHAAAVRRHLGLTRAAFGRPAAGPGGLPAYGWAPIPFGDSAEGHRTVRAALAEVADDPAQNFRLAVAQTADSEARDNGRDWAHRGPEDLRAFARRAAYAIARHLRQRRDGSFFASLPDAGPRIAKAVVEGAETTVAVVEHDRGRALKASRAALDGIGWSVFDDGRPRIVKGIELRDADRVALRHEPCAGPPGRREIGYCLLGEQLGRGNAVTDDWAGLGAPLPHGLDAAWRFDLPLQATLLPVAARPAG